MEKNLKMGIKHKLWLSPTVYNSLQSFVEFNADLHNIYIIACKDPTKQWRELPFVPTNDVIFNVLETWPLEWYTPDIATMEKSVAQGRKRTSNYAWHIWLRRKGRR